MKVGVAQPLEITFSEPELLNPDASRKPLRSPRRPGQTGDFHWFSNTMVQVPAGGLLGREAAPSPCGSEAVGVELGNGQVGNFNKVVTVHIGDKKRLSQTVAAHTFTASVNDQQVGKWPATMGDTWFPSARGFLVLMEK